MKMSKMLVAAWCFAPVLALAKGVPSASMDDPAGDITRDDGMDVTKVGLETDGKILKLTVTLKDDIVARGKANGTGGSPVEVYLDTDGNKTTGGKSFWVDTAAGFEMKIGVYVCLAGKGMTVCAGGIDAKAVESAHGSVDVEKLATGEAHGDRVLSSLAKEATAMTALSGNTVTASIPYATLGLKPGQDVRILVREDAAGFDAKSFFPEVTLAVK